MAQTAMIPDWLQPTFLLLPALLWMFLGVGIPWALALLPRADWHRRVTVLAVALALGPALTTTAMFLIGTFGRWALANVLLSSAFLAAIGLALALRQRRMGKRPAAQPLNWIDGALIVVIIIAVIARFWNTAYWPYDNYDEFWVYGYNAKIFMLQRAIPASMGYYPQLLPLSMAYAQLAWGALSEHAAKTVVPYFGLGSILMAYVLGARLFGRRAGLIGAAVWTLYAHHAGWAQYADLEIPVTLYFTGAAAFFIFAWRERNFRFALIGGLLAGAALWTKPTAGALIESVALIGGIIAAKAMFRPAPLAARLRRALNALLVTPIPIFALALLPMGSMWYVRNILFGLPPLVLPASYWQDAAQRSGQELGWPLLIAGLVTTLIMIRSLKIASSPTPLSVNREGESSVARRVQPPLWLMARGLRGEAIVLAGMALVLIGALPSAFDSPHPHRLTVIEYALIGAGGLLVMGGARGWWRKLASATRVALLLMWAFILPYFVTWFWSYSYHYRLSFAIVPLFTVQVGALLDRLWSPMIGVKRFRVGLAVAAILLLAIPGWLAALSGLDDSLNNRLPDDHAKQKIANPALIALVDFLRDHRDPNRTLHVEASGELRLPFFFPEDDVRTTDYPTRLDQITDVDYYVDSSVGERLALINGTFQYNQILASLTRDNVMKRLLTADDGDFRFWVYSVNNSARFQPPQPIVPLDDVQIGDFARLVGWEISSLKSRQGQRIFLTMYWQALKPSDLDYSVFIHLWNPKTQSLGAKPWGGEPVSGAFSVWANVPVSLRAPVKYHTRLWQSGEYIKDEWILENTPDIPPAEYELRVGLFEPLSGERLPVSVKGQVSGDSLILTPYTVLP